MKTILVVEDNRLNLELVEQLLEDDYVVITAMDGEAGVAAAITHKPDLILMDLSLPKIDGWEATARLRTEPDLQETPIIALTAHAAKEALDRAIAAGCDATMTKPIDEDQLLEEIARYINNGRGDSVVTGSPSG